MDFAEIVAFVEGVANGIYTFIIQIANVLVGAINAIIAAVNTLGAGTSTLSNNLFGGISSFFHDLWVNYIKIALAWVINEIRKLYDILNRLLKPLLSWIQKIRAWIAKYVTGPMLKQIQMIQKIRQFLVILRIFHVSWAQKLDNYLAGIQNQIANVIATTNGILNSVISWISLITDQTNMIRRSALGSWVLGNLVIIKRAVGYGNNRPLTSAEQAQMTKTATMYTTANVQAHVQALALTGPTDDDNARRAAARAALVQVTGAPLPF